MSQMVMWAKWADPTYTTAAMHDDFYTHPLVRGWYKSWIANLTSRVNTITGVAYRNEPAIFAWELANEPRCYTDARGLPSSGNCVQNFYTSGQTPSVSWLMSSDADNCIVRNVNVCLPQLCYTFCRPGRSARGCLR